MKQYTVIYADPPWSYGKVTPRDIKPGTKMTYISKITGKVTSNRAILGYPTMKLEDICALPVRDLAAKNCTLFLWGTSCLLPEAFKVMKAWGFNYKSTMVWNKLWRNMGIYNAADAEFLLIGTRGVGKPNVEIPGRLAPGRPSAIVAIQRTTHSVKPDWFVDEYIDKFWPNGDRIELFARRARPGWDVWGNEAPDCIDWNINERD